MTDPPRDHRMGGVALSSDLIELLPEPCALADAAGVVYAVNAPWRDVFVQTGLGMDLREACATLFRWAPEDWPAVAADLAALLAGELQRTSFEALLVELPERWCACSLALVPTGGVIWQLSDVTRWQMAESEATRLWQQFRDAVESITDGFALFDAEDRLVFCNRRFREIYNLSADYITPGRSFAEIVRAGVERGQYAEAVGREEAFIAERMASHTATEPVEHQLSDGRWVRAVDQPMAGGGIVGIRTDITTLRRAEEFRRQSAEQEATIRAQAVLLAELSTPLLRIGAGALVLPLVGSLDSYRAGRVVETLLRTIEEQRTDLVILDITGVPIVDTQVANVLLQTARAVRLLGARIVLTGIRPDVAQTIVALGVDLGDIITRADLQEGIKYALRGR
jgi:rsbT co-antagonist protein RsbR